MINYEQMFTNANTETASANVTDYGKKSCIGLSVPPLLQRHLRTNVLKPFKHGRDYMHQIGTRTN